MLFRSLYGKGRTDQAAGNTILHVYDFLRALPDYDRRLDEYLTPWQRENGFAFTCWHDLLLAEAARCAKAARELLTAALADCKEDFVLAQAQAEAAGVGLFLVFAFLRMLIGISLPKLLVLFYGMIFLLAAFVPKEFLAVAFDSGGVNTLY